jgi:hypothetical protein
MKTEIQTGYGPMTLFGSGETLPASGKAYDLTAELLGNTARIAVVETPAGFQPNSSIVAQKVADFMETRLQSNHPTVDLIPARNKIGKYSTNNPRILQPMLTANWVFLGPGSPTYAVRQIEDSLLMNYLYALHSMGGALTFSSAGVLAASAFTLPVYEIYKVGDVLHWIDGLNYLGPFGLSVVFIPHWNNNSGGKELDTSRCFIGRERFHRLKKLLPQEMPIIGIDEQTALTITFSERQQWIVTGVGGVTIETQTQERTLFEGEYDPAYFGFANHLPDALPVGTDKVIKKIIKHRTQPILAPPEKVIRLANDRLEARQAKEWARADALRDQIAMCGWEILDMVDGYDLKQK